MPEYEGEQLEEGCKMFGDDAAANLRCTGNSRES